MLRAAALISGAVGIAGMIVSSIGSSVSGALAFGLVCVAASIVLFTLGVLRPPHQEVDRLRGGEIERLINDLVAQGADEAAVRHLVRLLRSTNQPGTPLESGKDPNSPD